MMAVLLLLRAPAGWVPLDRPNDRSLHERPIPRAGGLAVLLGCLAGWLAAPATPWLVAFLALALCALSFADDLRGLPVAARLGSHFAAAVIVVPATAPEVPAVGIALLVLAVVWITNLYNFMDGSDGLAGGMTVFGFCAYAAAAWSAEAAGLAASCAVVAGAAASFLVLNFHPARIFLGDSGSIPLGFLAAALGLQGYATSAWPLWFPLLVFAPFIGDATLTLVRRLVRKERVWQAHRDHYYQRLVRMGFGHRRTAYISYVAMTFCALVAIWGRAQEPAVQALSFGIATAALSGFALWIDLKWKRSLGGRSA